MKIKDLHVTIKVGAANKINNTYFFKTSLEENNIILDNLFLQTMCGFKDLSHSIK